MEPNYNPYENSPEGENQNDHENLHDNKYQNNDVQNKNNFNPYEHTNFGYGSPQFQPRNIKRSNFFETASMVLAIGALVCCTCFYGAYIMGAMAILFALLSRGGQMKMSTKARLGLILGIIAIILTTVVTIGAFYIAIEEYGSIENLLRDYCNMYGLDFEQEFGILFE